MEKKSAFFISFMITLLIAGNYLFFYDFSSGREIVIISEVLDGDTIELDDGRRVRLSNIGAPEKGRYFSKEATEFLKEYEKESVELEIDGVGKYGRILGRIYSEENYLNLKIVELGFAHKYLVEEDELDKFIEVENNAIEKELGIWEKSEKYGCLDVEINKYDEYLEIEDGCQEDFENWNIQDESIKIYRFKKVLENNFKLFSGKGENKEGELYWGLQSVWNDDKDSIFIRDENGLLVYYDSYGY